MTTRRTSTLGALGLALSLAAGGCPAGDEPQTGNTACTGDLVACDGACVDTQSSAAHCGECGKACGAAQSCQAGVCVDDPPPGCEPACGADQTCDNGVCVDNPPPSCDPPCGAGQMCDNGVCVDAECDPACPVGQVCEAGQCVDEECTEVCSDQEFCAMGTCHPRCGGGETYCGGDCIDPATDDMWCGAFESCLDGVSCAQDFACVAGTCVLQCGLGEVVCNAECVDPQTNATYCGAQGDCLGANQGVVCDAGDECVAGACVPTCVGAEILCDQTCIDPASDTHCGATGCDAADLGEACVAPATCVAGTCEAVTPPTYVGALAATNGYWNYDNNLGIPGANAACDANFSGAEICREADLAALSPTGQLAGATDVNGFAVAAFWADDPAAPVTFDNDTGLQVILGRCAFGDPPWAHATGDVAGSAGGYYRTLDPVTGELAARMSDSCGAMHHVPCCVPAP